MRAASSTVRRSAGWHGLRAVPALLAVLWLAGLAHAQTAAGTVVTNVASAAFVGSDGGARTTPSNPVQSDVVGVCGLRITPDGTLASPGHAVVARPGETLSLPYLFTSAANGSADFDLEALLDPASALAPASIAVHLDLDGDGVLDPGEPAVAGLTGVAPGEAIALLLVITLADDDGVAGDVFVDVVGRCSGDPAIVDAGNVARVTVAREGVRAFVKDAVPAPGSALAPGAEVTYGIGFTVNEVALTGAVLSDTLDPLLDEPSAFVVRIDGVAQPGLATYDPPTRTVSATFGDLPPGTRVDLTVTAAVRDDAPAGAIVPNQAVLVHDGGADASNTVEHTVLGVCRLAITPDGSVAAPGQTVARSAGGTAVLAYEVRNAGNVATDVLLTAAVLAASSVTPLDVRIVLDLDGDGQPGPGEPFVTSLAGVPVGAGVALLVLIDLPPDAAVGGDVVLDLAGACAGEPTVVDDGNVGRVVVAPVGFAGPVKSAQPPSGEAVYPGAPLRYVIAFTVGAATLRDVVVRDTLDPRLEAPSLVLGGTIVDPDTGLSAVATSSFDDGTITWRFAEVPAGMTVSLAFETAVRREAPSGVVVTNRATLAVGAAGELGSNLTAHPVESLRIGLTKTATPEEVRPGGLLRYLLVGSNPSPDVQLPESDLVDTLPDAVRYVPGSTRLTLADGSVLALEPEVDGGTLRWRLPPLAPGERHEVRFDVRVVPHLASGMALVNHAELRAMGADGEVVVAAAASVATLLAPGALGPRSTLLGTAFVDADRDGRFDRQVDVPLAGLRLYLPDGRSTVTDADGRYTFPDLPAGITSLKLDATTLPPRWLDRTPAEASDGLWRLMLQPGTIMRQDLPFAPPEADLAARERLTVTMGPVTLVKSWADAGDGAVRVTLVVSAAEPLRGLVVIDDLPPGARVTSVPARTDGVPMAVDGLGLGLGDLAAGDAVEVRYELAPTGLPFQLTPPRIRWELRR
jgi:fimbrial isopeptide formation D2 family protein